MISLAAGFGVLVLSEFSVVAQFAGLVALAMPVVMVTDLVITPVLLKRLRLVGIWDVVAGRLGREEVLRNSPLFAGMSTFQIRKALFLSQVREYEPGQAIIRQGDLGEDMYVLLSGNAEVVQVIDREKHLVARLGCGNIFGESVYAGASRRSASVRVSLEDSAQVLILNAEKVANSMRHYPWVRRKLARNIADVLESRG